MSNEDNWDSMWHTGLRARLDTSFPKQCPNCGRVFETAEEYFNETQDINEQDKGLKSFVDDDTSVVIEAFRNCICGSTLMEMFEDPNDNTPEKIARRKKEAEFAKSMKVEDPLAENASSTSPEDSSIINENTHTEFDLINEKKKWGHEWYSGLRPSGASAFPKKCRNCGRVFETSDDFFTATAGTRPEHTGLRHYVDEDDSVVVEAFRNCPCGSTLMDHFSNRRDMSLAGRERRARFARMLNYLMQTGLDAATAYAELRKVARGEESKILAKIKPPE